MNNVAPWLKQIIETQCFLIFNSKTDSRIKFCLIIKCLLMNLRYTYYQTLKIEKNIYNIPSSMLFFFFNLICLVCLKG